MCDEIIEKHLSDLHSLLTFTGLYKGDLQYKQIVP